LKCKYVHCIITNTACVCEMCITTHLSSVWQAALSVCLFFIGKVYRFNTTRVGLRHNSGFCRHSGHYNAVLYRVNVKSNPCDFFFSVRLWNFCTTVKQKNVHFTAKFCWNISENDGVAHGGEVYITLFNSCVKFHAKICKSRRGYFFCPPCICFAISLSVSTGCWLLSFDV